MCSRSGTPKITYMGSVWVTEVSSTLGPDTSEPSDTAARLVVPAIGASTRVQSRFRRASFTRARALFTSASATCSAEAASSISFWLTALASSTGRRRATSRFACASFASDTARSPSARARAVLHFAEARRLRDVLVGDRHVFRLDRHDGDDGRREAPAVLVGGRRAAR